jgi:hypothetical protein
MSDLQSLLTNAVSVYRRKYESFDEAFLSYAGQYGDNAIRVYDPRKISETVDPVIIIVGRTTPLIYGDSKRLLSGSLSSISIEKGQVHLLGRREPPDSKLIVWSPEEEVEIEYYDSRVGIIPSRVHAAIFGLDNGDVMFTDLGSSSGSVIAGETSKPEPFIRLYATPNVDVYKVTINAKYRPPERQQHGRNQV